MASSLAAVALLLLVSTCVLHTVQAKVEEEIVSSIVVRDDKAPHLKTKQVMSARDKMMKAGLRSSRTRSTYMDPKTGDRLIKTEYTLAGPTSVDHMVGHARLLHKSFPQIFTEADVTEIESLVERRQGDRRIRAALNNRPIISITFRQVSSANKRVRREAEDDDWTAEVGVGPEVGRRKVCAFLWWWCKKI